MRYDIIIVGAGPAGLSMALALEKSNFNIVLIEKSKLEAIKKPKPDGREIALTHLSKKILKNLNCWQYLVDNGLSTIKKAEVYDGDSEYSLDFASEKTHDLGYMVSNYKIRKALYDRVVKLENVEIITDTEVTDIKINTNVASVTLNTNQTLNAKLAVAADSRFSNTRAKMGIGTKRNDFARTCIVGNLSHEKAHNSTAFECFHYERTLAILPMQGNHSSVVITVQNTSVDEIMSLSPKKFAEDVAKRLNYKLGKMQLTATRHCYPLTSVHAKQFVKPRFALLGDAAVGMHPVTAHGFNLGLRGADCLAKIIHNATDIGDLAILNQYQVKHMLITKPMYLGTNSIVDFFTNESKPIKLMRTALIRIANNCTPLKKVIIHSLTDTNQLPKFVKLPDFFKLPKLPKLPF